MFVWVVKLDFYGDGVGVGWEIESYYIDEGVDVVRFFGVDEYEGGGEVIDLRE